jgi:hypothetical protein
VQETHFAEIPADFIFSAERCFGWQESLRNLARLVEPDIRG